MVAVVVAVIVEVGVVVKVAGVVVKVNARTTTPATPTKHHGTVQTPTKCPKKKKYKPPFKTPRHRVQRVRQSMWGLQVALAGSCLGRATRVVY